MANKERDWREVNEQRYAQVVEVLKKHEKDRQCIAADLELLADSAADPKPTKGSKAIVMNTARIRAAAQNLKPGMPYDTDRVLQELADAVRK